MFDRVVDRIMDMAVEMVVPGAAGAPREGIVLAVGGGEAEELRRI